MDRHLAALFGAVIALGAPISQSSAADPAEIKRGRTVAEKWCAQCHVERRPTKTLPGVEDVPTFSEIAASDETDEDGLRKVLSGSHRQMPTDTLPDADIEAVIAYILSLKKK